MADETKPPAPEKPAKVKVDSTPKGSVNLWPLLRMETPDLVAKIVAGDCDGVLSELGEMAAGHPTKGPDGATERRGTVIDAVKARLRKA